MTAARRRVRGRAVGAALGRCPRLGRPLGRTRVEIKQGTTEFDAAERDAAIDAETEHEAASHGAADYERARQGARAGPAPCDDGWREQRLVRRLRRLRPTGLSSRSAGERVGQPGGRRRSIKNWCARLSDVGFD